jgi:hypothetical protein
MTKTHNRGFAGGIAKRSDVTRLAWALKGAPMRTKDLRLNAIAGVAEGRKLRDRVTTLMRDAKAKPEDAVVYCLFAEPDLSALVRDFGEMTVHNGASDLALATKFVDKLPIGFLVIVVDRKDPKRPIYGHARPLIVEDPRGLEMNEKALETTMRVLERRLIKSGHIPDMRN